jgi:flavodoxin
MKTREQDIEKFRQKWEKNRKQRFLLPMLITAGMFNIFVIWGMISVNSTYDVIFIGYPNWCGDMPMIVYTFLEKHNWQGKTVIPFCTNEGSGLSDTEHSIAKSCKGATTLPGLSLRGAVAQNEQEKALQQVTSWLNKLGF